MPIDVWAYLWALYLVILVFISVFMPVPCCLDDCSFVMKPEVREVDSSSSIFLSQDCFSIQGFLVFHKSVKFFDSSSVKNAVGNLVGIALSLEITLGSTVIFTILILLIQEHGISLLLCFL